MVHQVLVMLRILIGVPPALCSQRRPWSRSAMAHCMATGNLVSALRETVMQAIPDIDSPQDIHEPTVHQACPWHTGKPCRLSHHRASREATGSVYLLAGFCEASGALLCRPASSSMALFSSLCTTKSCL